MPDRSTSLRSSSILLVVAASLPALALIWLNARDLDRLAQDEANLRAEQAAGMVEATFRDLARDVEMLNRALVRIPEVRDAPSDTAACSAALAPVLGESGRFSNLVVLDETGSTLCAARPTTLQSVATTDRDQAILERATSRPELHYAGSAWGGEELGALGLFIQGIPPAAERPGVLIFTTLALNRGSHGMAPPGPSEIRVTVMGQSGQVLLQLPQDVEALPAERFGDPAPGAEDPQAVEAVLAEAGIMETALTRTEVRLRDGDEPILVLAGLEAGQRIAPSTGPLLRNFALLAGALALTLLAGWLWIDRRVRRPLRRTSEAARSLAQGDLGARVDPSRLPLEVAQVGDSFNRMASTLQDRDERSRRMAAELRESETRLREILTHTRDCVWLQDLETLDLLYVSPAYDEIWGRSHDELLQGGHRFLDTLHPDDRAASREARRQLPRAIHEEEYRVVRPNGEVRRIRDRSFLIRDPEGRPYRLAGIASDVTQRRELEERLMKAREFEAVGQLAGGIAHDFNNLLTVIRGHLQLLMSDPEVPPTAREELEETEAASARAAELIRQLLAFSRRQVLLPRPADLNQVVEDTVSLASRSLPETVSLEPTLHPEPLPVRVDPTQIEQVILNLVLNARDALPGGGRIVLATGLLEARGEVAVDGPVEDGLWTRLDVEDDGEGMSPQVARRIFEPFFTTKTADGGTGLGLASVQGIVAQTGGHIQLRTAPGEGTRFRLLFRPQTVRKAEEPSAPGRA